MGWPIVIGNLAKSTRKYASDRPIELIKLLFRALRGIIIPFGLHVVVIGNAVVSFLCFFINAYYPGKWFGLGAFVQLKIISKIINKYKSQESLSIQFPTKGNQFE
jgi:hypothetical protein